MPEAAPTPLTSPSPETAATASPAPASPTPAASLGSIHAAIPTPSLKPSEVITWIKLDRPRLELGQILVGSFVVVTLTLLVAVAVGIILGHWRARTTDTHGTRGLNLR